MNNYVQPGNVVTFTAPAGGVVSGGGYQVGQLFLVAASSYDAGDDAEGQVVGVFDLPKASADAPAQFSLLYWDDVASEVTLAATGNLLIGSAVSAALAGGATVRVRLNGVAVANSP